MARLAYNKIITCHNQIILAVKNRWMMECLPLNGRLPLRSLNPKLRTFKLLRLTSSTSPVKKYAFVKLKLIVQRKDLVQLNTFHIGMGKNIV